MIIDKDSLRFVHGIFMEPPLGVVKSMVASEKDFYSIYVFWDGETTDYSA